MSANMNKLRNLLTLAERGMPNERDVARRLLERMLLKHNLGIEDLRVSECKHFYFRYGNWMEKKLLFQVVAKVTNPEDGIEYYRRKGQGNRLGFNMTPTQAVDVDLLYNAYRKAWDKELRELMDGYVAANNIYGDATGEASELSAEEYERLMRVMRKAQGFDPLRLDKQLGSGE